MKLSVDGRRIDFPAVDPRAEQRILAVDELFDDSAVRIADRSLESYEVLRDRRARRRASSSPSASRPPHRKSFPGRSARPCGARCKNRRRRPALRCARDARNGREKRRPPVGRSRRTAAPSNQNRRETYRTGLPATRPSEPKDFDTRATATLAFPRHGLGSD